MTCTRRRLTYWTTCSCNTCTTDRLRAHKAHRVGLTQRVPNDAAWEILANRIDAGWTARALGSATNLDPNNSTTRTLYFSRHLAEYRKGRRVYLGPGVAALIMTMGQPTRGQVGAEPTRRRLRALAAVGHGLDTIAQETGTKFSTLAAIRGDHSQRCGAAIANAIADTYERLHMTLGDDTQAQRIAREKGWRAPMSYDDIDDANAPLLVDRQHKAPTITQARTDALHELVDAGSNISEACRRLKTTQTTLEKWCERHSLSALFRTLKARESPVFDATRNQYTKGAA